MGECPTLVYGVGSRGDAMALDELEAAARDGRLLLSLHVSDESTRFDPSLLAQIVDRADLTDVEVAVCGPDALVAAVERAGRTLGARRVHTEDFDIRQGFGPDLSREIDQLIRR